MAGTDTLLGTILGAFSKEDWAEMEKKDRAEQLEKELEQYGGRPFSPLQERILALAFAKMFFRHTGDNEATRDQIIDKAEEILVGILEINRG